MKLVVCGLVIGALALAACGGDDDDTTASGSNSGGNGAATTTTAAGEAGGAALVKTASTSLGDVLVTADGMTVYAFTNDKNGKPTCTGGCADAWHPVAVQGDKLPAGMDASIFSVAEGADESYQLAAKNQPLYTFTGDTKAGDVTGQGVGNSWYVVSPSGEMIKDMAGGGGATTTTAGSSSGGGGY
jgi:predicted lipoprotein with Yx(FWY)xxD motif